ncbi:MAG TPA: PhoH family protein, partial [Gammaproteobacteria bacterium]|nr:PhoH family protein [Gammaproteobacteria bacterium]
MDVHQFVIEPNDVRRLASLCGRQDAHLRLIESRLPVTIRNRGNEFEIEGEEIATKTCARLLDQLYRETRDSELTDDTVHLQLQAVFISQEDTHAAIVVDTPKLKIKPRGKNQLGYIDAIRSHDVNFGVGPAGTGKTWLGVASAVEALRRDQVERIILVRPAVEAGERLGFLPGDLAQKIDPYLRPLYDALYEMLGFDKAMKLLERQVIEIAPLAYMRGRTLNHSFIILDESQNTTREQMKMFLTRLGFGSTSVITGDPSQIDLPRKSDSGLIHACRVLESVQGISMTYFDYRDVVRHPLVGRIVDAY